MSHLSLANRVRQGDRAALAKAITLVESTRPDHRMQATALLDELTPDSGGALRVGISGTPGVGKSTFIEVFGLHLVNEQQLRVAVLAVDPSSTRHGGSILGDKTRMADLARHGSAFIRPTPSGGTLGGVARRTREVLLLCEAARYDVVLVETVGVGQSETAVARMTDVFTLLVAPGGGDELQGVKRGIMELADLVVVNKCDGNLEQAARMTLGDYSSALRLLRPRSTAWVPVAMPVSALTGLGVAEVWDRLQEIRSALERSGEFALRRAEQSRTWMWDELSERVLSQLRSHPGVAAVLASLEHEVMTGTRSPGSAVDLLMQAWSAT